MAERIQKMDMEMFWGLIDISQVSSANDMQRQADSMVELLRQVSVEEILEFDNILHALMDQAYDAALWDAADIIGCGCSDDGFHDFRAWLIAHGKSVYAEALASPESLVSIIEVHDNVQDGFLHYVVREAYKLKTGLEIPSGYRKDHQPPLLRGIHWSEENRKKRFPKLAAKFGDCKDRYNLF